MRKSIIDNHKRPKRGRPKTTGVTPMSGVRISTDLEAEIMSWADRQKDTPTKAEAIRRLIELGLASGNDQRQRRRQERALDDALANTFPASDPVEMEQPARPGSPRPAQSRRNKSAKRPKK
jgi:hypothetical protein